MKFYISCYCYLGIHRIVHYMSYCNIIFLSCDAYYLALLHSSINSNLKCNFFGLKYQFLFTLLMKMKICPHNILLSYNLGGVLSVVHAGLENYPWKYHLAPPRIHTYWPCSIFCLQLEVGCKIFLVIWMSVENGRYLEEWLDHLFSRVW